MQTDCQLGRDVILCFWFSLFALFVAGTAAADTSGAVSSAAGWYRVVPETVVGVDIRMHDWWELTSAPEVAHEVPAVVRQALDAQRLERLTGALDIRPAASAADLSWAAGQAAADFESHRREQTESGLLDGWLSEFVARQNEPGTRSQRGENPFGGLGAERRERSWGWLADGVYQRESETLGRPGSVRNDAFSDRDEERFDGFDRASPMPGWNPAGVGRTHGWDPDGGRATALPGWSRP